MGTTTFSGPVKAGSIREGASANTGGVVLSQAAPIVFAADGTETVIGILPANSQILNITLDVTTAFNAASTNTISFGDGATAGKYAVTLAAGSIARVLASSDVSQLTELRDIGSSDISVTATYNQSGTAASAGAAIATITYVQNNNLV